MTTLCIAAYAEAPATGLTQISMGTYPETREGMYEAGRDVWAGGSTANSRTVARINADGSLTPVSYWDNEAGQAR